eukprot:3894829-Pleurochrysis_carterae.AAC.1
MDSAVHVEKGNAQRATGSVDVWSESLVGRAASDAGAAASSVESCSRAESSSLCIVVNAVRAESSSRWADSRTLR